MSLTLTFSGTKSELGSEFFPPIHLTDDDDVWEVGLLSLETYNSIPNVDGTNNLLHYGDNKVLSIPEGTYSVDQISAYIQAELSKLPDRPVVRITVSNSTLQVSIKSSVLVDFTKENSIGGLLGFKKEVIKPGQVATSGMVDIFRINTIRVECNIATGSYVNGMPAHDIYQFFPTVPAGYKLVETPSPVIYVPVTVHNINNVTLRITDQDGELVNFRGERITIRLHLRKQ